MSSPLASLSKTRKVPLQSEPVNPGRRGIKIYGDEDEVDMLNDGSGSEERTAVPSHYCSTAAPSRSQGPGFSDSELMASMTRKLQELEQQVQAQTDEMLSKDQKILALEELVRTLQQHQGEAAVQRQEELETLCVQLQRQVREMERFLNDYGLQWVGEPMDQEDAEDKAVSEDDKRDWMTAKKFWKPGDSLVPPEVDFDRLLASLKDLSELVVEGDTQVIPVPGGARLHALEPIPLKLYQNGIMMFNGPFRPFHDPATQRCLRDILDGFFPSELQRLYPNGVPFKEIIVETPALAAERQRRQESPNTPAPPLCMLRVKSENGEQAFLLMMRPQDTVGTVRALLAQTRAMDAATFEIFSTFPPTVYQDDTLTLQAIGLVPSATLLLRARRALLPSPGFGPSPE
ncbi:PREDICTED: UBX domain-containing protein 11 isoform X5 [Chinchilla lanigera]|uniref:UBX domain-containing protein 11 isoform X5 n=1 Tax=Chinchilla lanigera TaxID=34839 RepID=UPI000697F89D|nr:PREDICTED: UBX domain-containing protein 11 isoform X5 [Chinchilla lanigera]